MDCVERFFQDLPPLFEEYRSMDAANYYQVIKKFIDAVENFKLDISEPSDGAFIDPDRKFLETLVTDVKLIDRNGFCRDGYCNLRSALGLLAMSKNYIFDDGTSKTRQLLYHRWICQGRKDPPFPREDTIDDTDCTLLPCSISNTQRCANCGEQGGAVLPCPDCWTESDFDIAMKIAYCSESCRAHHWQHHKAKCLERRTICRAVSMIYHIFVMFQQKVWIDRQITSITEHRGVINIASESDFEEEDGLRGQPLIRNFPFALAPSAEHGNAVLLNCMCEDVVIAFKGLVDMLLLRLGSCVALEEILCVPRNVHRPNCNVGSQGFDIRNVMFCAHTILRATLASGDELAINITGAQYGWKEIIAPFESWVSHRAFHGWESLRYGSTLDDSKQRDPGFDLAWHHRSELLRSMVQAIKDTIETDTKPGHVFADLSDAEFSAWRENVVLTAESALDDGLRRLDEHKLCRTYVNKHGDLQATSTPQQGQALEHVWLKDEETHGLDLNDMKSLYRSRCVTPGAKEKLEAAGLQMPDVSIGDDIMSDDTSSSSRS